MLEKHPKTDIGQIETASVTRDIRDFREVKDFRKMNFFHMKKTFANFMFNMLLYFAEIFAKMVKNREKAGIKKIQGVRCLVFSNLNGILPGVFAMAET